MNEILNIENRIESVNSQVQLLEKRLKTEGENFSLSLSIRSLKSHLNELQEQLRYEKDIREKEIIELRLKGKSVENGSIPLHLLGSLSESWSNAIISGANRLKSGSKAKSKAPKEVVDTLDLRLSGIGTGSTRLFITGKNSPDLFGNSLLEDTLIESFKLLSAESGDTLTEQVGKLGEKTADSIDKFLKTVVNNSLEVDILWNSPSEKTFKWEGSTETILKISQSLEALTEKEPEEIKFKGEIVTISSKGTFEIVDDSDFPYKGTFPGELLGKMKEAHIGERCSGVIIKKRVINQVTGYEKIFYELKSIKTKKPD